MSRAEELLNEFVGEGVAKSLVTAAQEELRSIVKFLKANNLTYTVDSHGSAELLATAPKGEAIPQKLLSTLQKPPYNAVHPALNKDGEVAQVTIPLPAQHKLNNLQRKAGYKDLGRTLGSK